MRGFNYKKAVQALNYLACKCEGRELNKMKAIKLIWLSDRFHLRKYGRTITGDVYFALPNGPVCSTTRDLLEQYQTLSEIEQSYSDEFIQPINRLFYKSLKEPNLKVFSQSDRNTLDLIFDKYSSLDQFQLKDLSHIFPEWIRYKSALEKRIISRAEMVMDDFFVNCDDSFGLFVDPQENLEIAKQAFADNLFHSSLY